LRRTIHALLGAAIGLSIAGTRIEYSIPCMVFGWIGGWFPDLDLKFKHRKTLHSLISMLSASALVYTVLSVVEAFLGLNTMAYFLTLSFFSGWILHVISDSLTVKGVYILWPISDYRLRLASFKSNSLLLNIIGVLLSLTIIIFLIYSMYLRYYSIIFESIKNILRT